MGVASQPDDKRTSHPSDEWAPLQRRRTTKDTLHMPRRKRPTSIQRKRSQPRVPAMTDNKERWWAERADGGRNARIVRYLANADSTSAFIGTSSCWIRVTSNCVSLRRTRHEQSLPGINLQPRVNKQPAIYPVCDLRGTPSLFATREPAWRPRSASKRGSAERGATMPKPAPSIIWSPPSGIRSAPPKGGAMFHNM